MNKFTMGKHLLLEAYNISFFKLDNALEIRKILFDAAERAEMRVLNVFHKQFDPQGCTVVIALAESHISCHTWPEEGCISADVFTCGDKNPKIIMLELLKYLDTDDYNLREVDR